MLTDMLSCICMLRQVSKHLFISMFKIQKKIELNELEYSKAPSTMSSYTKEHIFLYLHAKKTSIHFFIEPTQNCKKSKRILIDFFVKKD